MSLGNSIFGVPIGRPTFESITAPIAKKAQELRAHAVQCEGRADTLAGQIERLQAEVQLLDFERTKSHALAAQLEGLLTC